MRWLSELPFPLLLAILVLPAAALGLALGRSPHGRRAWHDRKVANPVTGAPMTLFALVAALLIVAQAGAVDSASDLVDKEAGILATIVLNGDALGGADGTLLQQAAFTYRDSAVGPQAEALARGDDDAAWTEFGSAAQRLGSAIHDLQASSTADDALVASAAHDYDQLVLTARERLASADAHVADLLVLMLLLVGMVLIAYSSVIGWTEKPASSLPPVLSSTTVALALVIVIALAYPYSGSMTVDLTAFYRGSLAG